MKVTANFNDRRVCIIGLGYVGLTLAVAMAEVGFEVYGVDTNEHIVNCVQNGHAHFKETGLDQRLGIQVAEGNLVASTEWPERGHSNVFIITVGTPLDADIKKTNMTSITAVSEKLVSILEPNDMVILRSTVRVGVSRDVVKPVLDKAGMAYDIAFCPERTLEGKALLELRTLPQIVGGLNDNATMRASQVFAFLTPTIIRVADLETSEMIKLINNTQRDLMFAFANEVADMCDAVGVSAIDVIRAGNMGYARASMPVPGPVGGPCLEKDPFILSEGVELNGGNPRMPLLGREIHETLPERTADTVAQAMAEKNVDTPIDKICVLGLAFKGRPETSDLRGTLAIPLLTALKDRFPGAEITSYDPLVSADEAAEIGYKACASPEDAFKNANCVIYQNNNPKFEHLNLAELSSAMKPSGVIYDLWNQYDSETLILRNDVSYFGLGTKVLLHKPRGLKTAVAAE